MGAESRSQAGELPRRSWGVAGRRPRLASAKCCVLFFFPFPFPRSLKLRADSHVGGLIKPHVLPDGPMGPGLVQTDAWGRRSLAYEHSSGWPGHSVGERTRILWQPCLLPVPRRESLHFADVASNFNNWGCPGKPPA